MNRGFFISFEGTEGGGKSTQILRLAARFKSVGRDALVLREPGGTPIGEEIRHLLKHSEAGHGMTGEAELLLMCASRAQLVREVIRPALAADRIVLTDRFHDSTLAYQGYGRQLDLDRVRAVIDFAIGNTRPDLTLFLHVPVEVSEARRRERQQGRPEPADRFEAAGREFFRRVEQGFLEIARTNPARMKLIDATGAVDAVESMIWNVVEEHLGRPLAGGSIAR